MKDKFKQLVWKAMKTKWIIPEGLTIVKVYYAAELLIGDFDYEKACIDIQEQLDMNAVLTKAKTIVI